MYLRIRPGRKLFQVGTFFDFGKDHTKMYLKQKKKCIKITLQEIKTKYCNPCGEELLVWGQQFFRNADSFTL